MGGAGGRRLGRLGVLHTGDSRQWRDGGGTDAAWEVNGIKLGMYSLSENGKI